MPNFNVSAANKLSYVDIPAISITHDHAKVMLTISMQTNLKEI